MSRELDRDDRLERMERHFAVGEPDYRHPDYPDYGRDIGLGRRTTPPPTTEQETVGDDGERLPAPGRDEG